MRTTENAQLDHTRGGTGALEGAEAGVVEGGGEGLGGVEEEGGEATVGDGEEEGLAVALGAKVEEGEGGSARSELLLLTTLT